MEVYDHPNPEEGPQQEEPQQEKREIKKNREGEYVPKMKPSYARNLKFESSYINANFSFWNKFIFFLIGFVGLELLSFICQLIFLQIPAFTVGNGFSAFGASLLNLLVYIIIFAVMLVLLLTNKKKPFFYILQEFKLGSTFGYMFMALGIITAFNYLFSIIYRGIPIYGSNANQEGIETLTFSFPIMMVITTVFLAPFTEELTYRIGLLDTIGHKFRWLGIVISAIIFGLVHFDYSPIIYIIRAIQNSGDITLPLNLLYIELLNLPIYISMGGVLGFFYAKTGRITVSWGAHTLNNLIAFISALLYPFVEQLLEKIGF